MTELRQCCACKKLKPISEFRMWKRAAGIRPSPNCDDCRRAIYRSEHYRQVQNRKHAARRAAGKLKYSDASHAKRSYAKYPEKAKAKRAVRTAIESGKLIKPSVCDACGCIPKPLRDGRPGLQGHHPDYSRPLAVEWLCHACHQTRHKVQQS